MINDKDEAKKCFAHAIHSHRSFESLANILTEDIIGNPHELEGNLCHSHSHINKSRTAVYREQTRDNTIKSAFVAV